MEDIISEKKDLEDGSSSCSNSARGISQTSILLHCDDLRFAC